MSTIKYLKNYTLTPDPSPVTDGTLLHGPIYRVLPSYFDSIDEAGVSKAASLIKGAGGHSQLASELNLYILSSRKLKNEDKEIIEQKIIDSYIAEALIAY